MTQVFSMETTKCLGVPTPIDSSLAMKRKRVAKDVASQLVGFPTEMTIRGQLGGTTICGQPQEVPTKWSHCLPVTCRESVDPKLLEVGHARSDLGDVVHVGLTQSKDMLVDSLQSGDRISETGYVGQSKGVWLSQ